MEIFKPLSDLGKLWLHARVSYHAQEQEWSEVLPVANNSRQASASSMLLDPRLPPTDIPVETLIGKGSIR